MAYKGNDLDLRPARPSAPAREAPGAAERAAAAAGARPASADPIPVDDAVLACCNCAYDVARFHGSEDVRLEHLLHALTRVGAAAELLAELGDPRRYPAARDRGGDRRGDAGRPRRRPCDAARVRRLRGRAAASRRPGRQAQCAGRLARPAQDRAGWWSRLARGRPADAGRGRPATARALARRAASRRAQSCRA